MTIKQTIITVLDTETCGLTAKDGGVYDFAYAICTKKGEILKQENHLVEEVATNAPKMMGAFYAHKTFSHYFPLLDKGLIDIWPWGKIREQFLQDCQDFGVSILAAYNLGFDARALGDTHQLLTGGKQYLNFKPRMLDIWQIACQTVLNRRGYKELAKRNDWMSEAGNIRTTAEHAFRYIANDHEFIEHHTALEDVIAEVKILAECFRQKKKIPFGIMNAHPWRIVNA